MGDEKISEILGGREHGAFQTILKRQPKTNQTDAKNLESAL